ncbi:MAG: AAA family ATPase, partial [Staphylococcus simulans]|nr:AAA family ATPase [Staphylococcus simulans]
NMAERILVIGSPGTGKSTFAKQLSQKMNIPVFHLDKLFWKNDHETINQEEFIKQIEKVIAENEYWIIDGNYRDTLPLRLEQAELVIWLKAPRWKCILNVVKRYFRLLKNEDTGGNPKSMRLEFVKYIWDFPMNHFPSIIQAKTNSLNRAKWIELNGFKEMKHFMRESEFKIKH